MSTWKELKDINELDNNSYYISNMEQGVLGLYRKIGDRLFLLSKVNILEASMLINQRDIDNSKSRYYYSKNNKRNRINE